MALAGFDWLILVIIGFSTLIGFFMGFIRSILSVLVWVGAVIASMIMGPSLAQAFSSVIDSPAAQLWLSYGVVFILALVVGWVLKMIVNLMFIGMRVGCLNMMLGVLFGFIRGLLLVIVLMWFVMLSGLTQNTFFSSGSLSPYFLKLTQDVVALFPSANAAVQDSIASLKSSAQGLGSGLGSNLSGSTGTGSAASSSGNNGGIGLGTNTVSGSIGAIKNVVSQAVAAVKTNLGGLGR